MNALTLTRKQWYMVCDKLEAFGAPHEDLLANYILLVMGRSQGEITLYFKQYDYSLLLPIVAEVATKSDA